MSAEQFSVWVIRLGGHVHSLKWKAQSDDILSLEKEADTCEAEIEHLYAYALQHHINITEWYPQIADIYEQLGEAKRIIEYRKRPWWKKALEAISRLIRGILRILQVRLELPGGLSAPALPPPLS